MFEETVRQGRKRSLKAKLVTDDYDDDDIARNLSISVKDKIIII
jgi:hypothetical protein